MCFVQAAQIKNVLATGAISGAQKLAQMAGKTKTQLQQTEAEVSSEQGSEHSMVERSVECRCASHTWCCDNFTLAYEFIRSLCLFRVTILRRLRHLEDERLQLLQKATNFQSKSVRYKMLAAKVGERLLFFVIDTALVFCFLKM